MDKEIEKLTRLNEFMRDRLIWFAENSWNADVANHMHQEALKDLAELEKEIDTEFAKELEYKAMMEELSKDDESLK